MTELVRDGSSPEAIVAAVAVLGRGGLVGMPTETVYGLAADAASADAVGRIFEVKGRPHDHPLILHVAADSDPGRWAVGIPGYVEELVNRFWPGPLTIVLPKRDSVGDFVTGGQPTVALRSPDHPVAQRLLAGFGGAVAAPSANRFGAVSPTTAADVLAELGSQLDPARDAILDGGPCAVGLESTILDCTGPTPRVLRPGGVGAAEISEVVAAAPDESGAAMAPATIRVPGSLASHYSPQARVVLVPADPDGVTRSELEGLAETAVGHGRRGDRIGLIAMSPVPTPGGWLRLLAADSVAGYAHDLYGALRAADEHGLELVVAVPPSAGAAGTAGSGLELAVLDRLRRAAG